MDISKDNYKIVFTKDSIREMDSIYNYISNKLYAPSSAKKLMKQVEEEIQNLKHMPQKYGVIKQFPEIEMEYRRIVIKNYVIIYAISEIEHTIYVVHMFYGKSNYLNNF